jgi:hypothetical protein
LIHLAAALVPRVLSHARHHRHFDCGHRRNVPGAPRLASFRASIIGRLRLVRELSIVGFSAAAAFDNNFAGRRSRTAAKPPGFEAARLSLFLGAFVPLRENIPLCLRRRSANQAKGEHRPRSHPPKGNCFVAGS